MTVKERLITFIRAENIPVAQFERACGMSNGYINSIRKTLGVEKLDNVLNSYPHLNREWLLTGNGSMLLQLAPKHEKTAEKGPLTEEEITEKEDFLEKRIQELQEEINILKDERSTLISTNARLSQMLETTINHTFQQHVS